MKNLPELNIYGVLPYGPIFFDIVKILGKVIFPSYQKNANFMTT